MTTTRRHFGSVRKLPSGRYQASYWHEGERHTAPDTYKAKADAQAFLSVMETNLLRGEWLDPAAGRETFGSYGKRWLAHRPDLRPSTTEFYDALWRKSAGVNQQLHFHDLRGSGATWAAIAGATVRELMARLGHSTPEIALRYQHATRERDRAIADKLGALLSAVEAQPEPSNVIPIERDTEDTSRV